jgi:quercetin dioxygenase-like cupin family protein
MASPILPQIRLAAQLFVIMKIPSGHYTEAIMKRKESSVDLHFGRRDLFRAAAAMGVAGAAASLCAPPEAAVGAAAEDAITPAGAGIRAFKLYTGPDNASHVLEGTIDEKARTDVIAIHFKETPAHSSYDWHPDPEPQYVITLSGTLEFTTRSGETFVLRPGHVLLAEDNVGTGHKWRLIDDQPWRRAYIVLKPGAKDSFVRKVGIGGDLS